MLPTGENLALTRKSPPQHVDPLATGPNSMVTRRQSPIVRSHLKRLR